MVVRNVRQNPAELLHMLEALRQGAQGSSAITVRILAAADHDGVCATKIMVTVLQRAGIKYTVLPVTGNSEIIEHVHQLGVDSEVRSLVLLNCGASLDLERSLEEYEAPANLMCFVIDAHRPLLLANLSARNKRVVVLDDDPTAEKNNIRPPVEEADAASQLTDDAEGSGSDEEKENVLGQPLAEDSSGRGPGREERKRRRTQEMQARQERKRQRINEYYMTSYCASPAALSLFKLAKLAASPSQDLLWLAAVALAGYHDQGLLSDMKYQRTLQEELKESNDRVADSLFSGTPSAGDTVPEAASDDEDLPPSRRPPPRRSQEKHALRFEKDLRLTLYKHWALEESMMHSSYFYGMLGLHRDKGLRALKNFFATAGIPPSDYRQMFSCMQMKSQKGIANKFRQHGKAYGLSEGKMFLDMIVRDLGPLGEMYRALYLNEVSCLDAVHVVSALLSVVPPELSGTRSESLPKDASGKPELQAVETIQREAMVANFWRAFDAVLCKEPQTLRDGIAAAVEVAKAVQSQGRLIWDTKAMHKSGNFYWCRIEQPTHILRHHVAVRRLAVWLLHVVYTYRPDSSAGELPLMVIVKDKVRDTYLCVGATPSRLSEEDEFGSLFRQVLKKDSTLKYRYDFFDKSCIEIAADDFDRFWDLMNSD